MSKANEIMLSPLSISQLKQQLIDTTNTNVTCWVEAQSEWFEAQDNATDAFPMGMLKWMDRLVSEVKAERQTEENRQKRSSANGFVQNRLNIKIVSNFRVKKTFVQAKGELIDDYQIVLTYPDQKPAAQQAPKKPSVTVTTGTRKAIITRDLFESFSPDGVVCVDRWALALGPKGLYWAHAFHREGIYDDTTYCPADAEGARNRAHNLIRRWAGLGDMPIDTAWKKFFWYVHTNPEIRGKMALPEQEQLIREILAQMRACSNPRDEEVVAFAARVIQKEIDMGVSVLTTNVTKQGWGTNEVANGTMTYEKYSVPFEAKSFDGTQV